MTTRQVKKTMTSTTSTTTTTTQLTTADADIERWQTLTIEQTDQLVASFEKNLTTMLLLSLNGIVSRFTSLFFLYLTTLILMLELKKERTKDRNARVMIDKDAARCRKIESGSNNGFGRIGITTFAQVTFELWYERLGPFWSYFFIGDWLYWFFYSSRLNFWLFEVLKCWILNSYSSSVKIFWLTE